MLDDKTIRPPHPGLRPLSAAARHYLPITLVLIATLSLLMFRNHRLFVSPEYWAEDIDVYFTQHRLFGISAVLMPWNGFVQLICRVYAWLAAWAPLEYGPRIYATLFVLSVTGTAVLVYTSPAFTGLSKGLATLCLLLAPTSSEVFFGMCYAQWVIGPAVGLALYEQPTSNRRIGAMVAAFTIVGLSSPFVFMAAPFTLWKAISEKSRYSYALCASTVIAGAIHAYPIFLRFSDGASGGTAQIKFDALLSIFYRWMIGRSTIPTNMAVYISVLTITLVAFHFWRNRDAAKRPLIYLFGYGAVLLIICCASIKDLVSSHQYSSNGRYFYIPSVLFLWSYIVAEQNSKRNNAVAAAFCAALALSFFSHADRAGTQFKDTGWTAVANCLRVQTECLAEVNPAFLGARYIPTDKQVATFTNEERRNFKKKIENIYLKE